MEENSIWDLEITWKETLLLCIAQSNFNFGEIMKNSNVSKRERKVSCSQIGGTSKDPTWKFQMKEANYPFSKEEYYYACK